MVRIGAIRTKSRDILAGSRDGALTDDDCLSINNAALARIARIMASRDDVTNLIKAIAYEYDTK